MVGSAAELHQRLSRAAQRPGLAKVGREAQGEAGAGEGGGGRTAMGPSLTHCLLVSVMKPGEDDENDGDEGSDSGAPADALAQSNNAKKTPTKRPKELEPYSDSIIEEVNKKKPPKKKKDATPTATFQSRVDRAKGAKPAPKK